MIKLMGEEKHTITLPPSCIDPKTVKVGEPISYNVTGSVLSIDAKHGVTIEIKEDENDYKDDEDDMAYDADEKDSKRLAEKMKSKMSKKLEEYQ